MHGKSKLRQLGNLPYRRHLFGLTMTARTELACEPTLLHLFVMTRAEFWFDLLKNSVITFQTSYCCSVMF